MSNDATFDFTGTSVLVTGGTSGIGHAIAGAFADAGAHVIVTGTRSAPDAYDTDLEHFGYRQVEMTDTASIESLVGSLDALDILVNNAGANLPGGRDEWEPDVFATTLEINLAGPMRVASGCRPLLAASTMVGGASVVHTVSMAAFRAIPIVPGYASAKAGLAALTANMAKHWYRHGIRVNAVAPGVIDTPMTAPMTAFPELLDGELARISMGRLGTPHDVVGAVQFLSSAAAAYVTGHILVVDGGYLLG